MTLDVMTLLLALGALSAAVTVTIVCWISPRATMILWTIALFFVPVWVGANLGIFWSAITVLTFLAIIVQGRRFKPHPIDAFVLIFLVLASVLLGLGLVELSPYVTALSEWLLPYLWGRIVLECVPASFVIKCIATAATIVAVLAIVEFVTSVNFFVLIPGTGIVHTMWSTLQARSEFIRAEGAFGHSIALGAAMAMSAAFVLAAPWRTFFKVSALALLGVATVVTFSRIGLVTFALTVALSLLLLREMKARARWVIALVLVIAVAVVVPFIADVFLDAGQEAGGSADYRTDLFVLRSQVQWLGGAGDWKSLIVGDDYLGYFARSIDNAVMLALLQFGYLPTAVLFASYLSTVVLVLRPGRMNAAGIAIIAQLPSLWVVALITQYGMMLWFCIGLALTWAVKAQQQRDRQGTATSLLQPDWSTVRAAQTEKASGRQ